MFNLESSITRWREQMLASGIRSPVPLEELEVHLREEIEQQTLLGSNPEQAFMAAIQKIGGSAKLNAEFKKVPASKENFKWQWKQIQIMFFTGMGVISLFTATCILCKLGSFAGVTAAQQLSGLAALAMMILPAVGGRLACGFFPVIRSKRIRDVIGVSTGAVVVLWWALFFLILLPRIDYTLSQLGVLVLWVMMPALGILGGITAGIEAAAWKNQQQNPSANRG